MPVAPSLRAFFASSQVRNWEHTAFPPAHDCSGMAVVTPIASRPTAMAPGSRSLIRDFRKPPLHRHLFSNWQSKALSPPHLLGPTPAGPLSPLLQVIVFGDCGHLGISAFSPSDRANTAIWVTFRRGDKNAAPIENVMFPKLKRIPDTSHLH